MGKIIVDYSNEKLMNRALDLMNEGDDFEHTGALQYLERKGKKKHLLDFEYYELGYDRYLEAFDETWEA